MKTLLKPNISISDAEYFKLLEVIAEPTRLQILLLLLKEGELNQKTIQDKLSISTQSKTSRHLSYLYTFGAVFNRTGVTDMFSPNQVMYSIASYYKPALQHILSPML